MVNEYQIRVVPQVAAGEESIRQYVAREYGFDARTVTGIRVLKRSIDARQRTVYVNLKVRVYINEQPHDDMFVRTEYGDVSGARRVVVVGEGPGGLFAALRLIELGLCPVVVERGKDVHERKKDLSRITKTQQVDTESNYCFGEGGAGAYSDGKLYTRSKKRGNTEKILNVFCQHGASTAILADAHPHIGTEGDRKHEEHDIEIGRRSASRDQDDKACSSRRRGQRHRGCRPQDGHGAHFPRSGDTGHRSFGT